MRKLLFLFCLLTVEIVLGQELELRLKSESNKFSVGQIVELQLIIQDVDKYPIIDENELDIYSFHQFVYDFSFTTEREGKILLGSYTIEINNQELVSNTLEIIVKDKEFRENKIELIAPRLCDKNTQITIELVSHKAPISKIRMKENPSFKFEGSSSTSNTSIKNGKATATHKAIFRLTFLEEGTFIIDEEWFENIPEFYSINNTKVNVVDPDLNKL